MILVINSLAWCSSKLLSPKSFFFRIANRVRPRVTRSVQLDMFSVSMFHTALWKRGRNSESGARWQSVIPRKLTCPPKKGHPKRKVVFQPLFFTGLVRFLGHWERFFFQNPAHLMDHRSTNVMGSRGSEKIHVLTLECRQMSSHPKWRIT